MEIESESSVRKEVPMRVRIAQGAVVVLAIATLTVGLSGVSGAPRFKSPTCHQTIHGCKHQPHPRFK
jgi:hypothetical protein